MLSCTIPQYPLMLLSSLHKRRFRSKHVLSRQPIPSNMLCVIIQGKGLLQLDHRAIPLQPNQIYFLQPSMNVDIILESSCIEYYVLMFSSVAVGKRLGNWICSPGDEARMPLPPGRLQIRSVKPILDRIERMYRNRRSHPDQAQRLQLEFQSLLQAIADDVSEQDESAAEHRGIDQTVAYMYKHFHEKVKLDTLSDIAGLTQTSYSRSFKKAKGVSPMEYLNQIRIDSSKQMLEQNYSIKEAAESVGIGNPFYFSRMFKRALGISPAVYVQRRQLRVAVACSFRYEDNLRSLGIEPLAELNKGLYVELSPEEYAIEVGQQLQLLRQACPDLIIADCRHRQFYEQLKRIAPTVVLEFTANWRQNHRKIAELVGRESEAEQNLRKVEQRIQDARKRLSSIHPGETFSFMRLYSQKVRMQGLANHPMNTLLYAELGLKPGGNVPPDIQYREFDVHQVPPFDTDYLYICKLEELDGAAEFLTRMQQNACRDGIQAASNQHIRLVSNWIGKSWSPIGQHQIMDELLQGELSQG